MLSRLFIRNYAIIDELNIEFSSRLNIITGETGAGKSIIVGALGLVLGERADSSALLNRESKCIVEAYFSKETNNEDILSFLKGHELDIQEELVVRREISPTGKSRAFVNDTPVNLSQLNELSKQLVDLHQQFDTLELGQADFQRDVLDALAGTFNALAEYKITYNLQLQSKQHLQSLEAQKQQFDKELDYHQFQFTELEEAGFSNNELEEIDQELKLQSNAEGIKTALSKAAWELEEKEEPVLSQLKSLIHSMQPYSALHPDLPTLLERMQSSYIELQDIADEAQRISDHISADPAAIERMNERLSVGYRLLKKHGVKTTNELLSIKDELEQKLQAVLNIDDAITAVGKDHEQLLARAAEQAEKISTKRKAEIKPLEQQVNKMLAQVGMPNARFKVDLTKKELDVTGMDKIEFLFDANKSNVFHPLRKVASGGELSRLMLCIKSLVARSMNLPTMIFDEIDTGISGEAAKQVGAIMKELASARQVICITHQPQIAGKADAHFLVYKAVKGNVVTTGVKLLDTDDRIVAIARMLSGEKPTAAAIENAKEMIMN